MEALALYTERNRAIAKTILNKIDPLRRKTDIPIKPIIIEIAGMPKSGKDTQLPRIERFFKRLGYQVLIHQESAENAEIRSLHRKAVGSYAFEMKHFSFSLSNLISAAGSRNFHLVIQNRGIIDTLIWLEWNKRLGVFSEEQVQLTKDFIVKGPWLNFIDILVLFKASIAVSLEREYGTSDVSGISLGSRMNPRSLAAMEESIQAVQGYLSELKDGPTVIVVDTSEQIIEETTETVLNSICSVLYQAFNVEEEELLLRSIGLIRNQNLLSSAQLKFRGWPNIFELRRNNWILCGNDEEIDTFLKPRNVELKDGECFHIRESGNSHSSHLIYKVYGGGAGAHERMFVPPIPIFIPDGLSLIFEDFEKTGVVKKTRVFYVKNGLMVCLDRIEGLGEFTEIKNLNGSDYSILIREGELLGLCEKDITPVSYRRLLKEK